MSKSAPKAPDYAAAAREQAQSSAEVTNMQTWANRPDQVTPWGSQTWTPNSTVDPATGQRVTQWTQNTTLTPEGQKALDDQMALTGLRSDLALSLAPRLQSEYGQQMDWSQLGEMPTAPTAPTYSAPGAMTGPAQGQQYQIPGQMMGPAQAQNYSTQGLNNFGQGPQGQQYSPEQIQRGLDTSNLQQVDPSQRYYQQAGDAVYNQWAQRAMPEQARATDALRTQLYNQGLREGDQAFDREIEKQRFAQGDAQQQAAFQATQMAGQEAQRMYGMDQGQRQQQFNERLQGGQFANQASQQALNQQLGIGGQQFSEGMQGANYQNQLRQQQLNEMMGLGQQNYENQQAYANQFNQQRAQGLAEQMTVGQQNLQNQQNYIDQLNAQRAAGLQEQMAIGQQNFQNQMSGSNYQMQLRQQQIAEAMQQRGFSLNEINALLTGQQVAMPSMPGFQSAQRSEGLQSLNAAQMQGQADLDRYNAQQQATQGMMSGIGSIAGGFMPSSRLVKKRVKRIGTTPGGTPIYQFQYVWGGPMQIGVMADEAPAAAVHNIDGAIYVDYSKVT